MDQPDWKGPLGEAFDQALAYLEGLPGRPPAGRASLPELRAALGGPLPERPQEPREVVADLATAADQGVVASGSGRYFGFVVGGATPAALAADWLTSAWDQNAGLYVLGPAASVVEEVAGRWLAELLGLPAGVSAGFVTGAQMANFTGLAVALQEVLRRAGWDLAADGLWGAPRVRVLAGQARHGTIDRALRFLGVGSAAVVAVDADPDAIELTRRNAEAYAVRVRTVLGSAPPALVDLPDPDAAFVGGGGTALPAILAEAAARTRRVVVTTVALVERIGPAIDRLTAHGLDVSATTVQASRLRPLPGGHRLAAENPVTVVVGRRL